MNPFALLDAMIEGAYLSLEMQQGGEKQLPLYRPNAIINKGNQQQQQPCYDGMKPYISPDTSQTFLTNGASLTSTGRQNQDQTRTTSQLFTHGEGIGCYGNGGEGVSSTSVDIMGIHTFAQDSAITLDFSQCADYIHLPKSLYPQEAREIYWTETEYNWRVRNAQKIEEGGLQGVYDMLSNRFFPNPCPSVMKREMMPNKNKEDEEELIDSFTSLKEDKDKSKNKDKKKMMKNKRPKNENNDNAILDKGTAAIIDRSSLDRWLDGDMSVDISTGSISRRERSPTRTNASSLLTRHKLFELRLSPIAHNRPRTKSTTHDEKTLSLMRIENMLERGPLFEQRFNGE